MIAFRAVEYDVPITVSGGTGSGTLLIDSTLGAFIRIICIKTSPANNYAIEIVDGGGFSIWGNPGLSDSTTMSVDIPFRGTATITVTGSDGSYSIRFWCMKGP